MLHMDIVEKLTTHMVSIKANVSFTNNPFIMVEWKKTPLVFLTKVNEF